MRRRARSVGPGARYEFYPHTIQGGYDPWVGDVGSVHIDSTGGNVFNLGPVTLPRVGVSVGGSYPAVRLDGDILSSTPVNDGRVSVNSFQVPTVYPDPPRDLASNGSVLLGSFSSGANRGNRWTAGVGWPGRYILFVTDNATGREIQVFSDLGFAATPTIDLDAICFGFDVCQYNKGAPGTTSGTFHPTAPTRILDTRFGVGISEPIRSGGGRYDTDDPNVRRAETANHELKVTGVGGVPEAGVSAVLLNVTAVVPPGPGYVALTPKAPHSGSALAIFDDQASVPAGEPATSNLNVAGGDIVPNLVLARVGAGGKIRIYNWWGPTEMVADIAGWIGTGGAHTNGSGFTGVTPVRVLDSRNNIGTTKGIFAPNETRSVRVAGVAGVPTNAVSVVVNITVTQPQGSGFATAFPTGVALPTASNLNYVPGTTRANLAVVKVGTGGQISLNAAETSAHLIVDVMGSFGPYGGWVEAIDPVRLVDTRNSTGPMDVDVPKVIQVSGQAGVPAGATCSDLERHRRQPARLRVLHHLADRCRPAGDVERELRRRSERAEHGDGQARDRRHDHGQRQRQPVRSDHRRLRIRDLIRPRSRAASTRTSSRPGVLAITTSRAGPGFATAFSAMTSDSDMAPIAVGG